jgi:hypothetical protein
MAKAEKKRRNDPNDLDLIQNAPPCTVVCVVALKMDLSEWQGDDSVHYRHPESKECVSSEDGQDAADMISGMYFEVDLNTGEGLPANNHGNFYPILIQIYSVGAAEVFDYAFKSAISNINKIMTNYRSSKWNCIIQ